MVVPGEAIALVKACEQVAIPVVLLIATALQRTVTPCVKLTLPVGLTEPDGAVTVAVKVTCWFTDAVGSEDDRAVRAAVFPTVSVNVAGAATVKFESPLYVAVMTSAGTRREEVVQVAAPAAVTVFAGQSLLAIPFIVKDTVPEGVTGVSATPASWAVKVTEVPAGTEAAGEAVKLSVAGSAVFV